MGTNSKPGPINLATGHADDLMSWPRTFQGAGASGFYPDGITSSKPWYVASELKDEVTPRT